MAKPRRRWLWVIVLLAALSAPAALAYKLLTRKPAPKAPRPPAIGSLLPPLAFALEKAPKKIRVLRAKKPYSKAGCAAAFRGKCVEEIPLEAYVEGVVLAEEGLFVEEREGFFRRLSGRSVAAAAAEAWALQALAARTYALYTLAQRKHGKDPYDIDDTPRDQAYSDRRDPRAAAAVRRTAGRVLVDARGRLLPAEYSAACGGLGTWSVLEPGRAIPCHARCDEHGYPKSSHWRGMSQWGSFEFARDGETLTELIARYYPGARLGTLGQPAPRDPLRELLLGGVPL